MLTLFSEHMTFERNPKTVIICNSHLVKQEILHFYPRTRQDRLIVVHNGVEWNEYEEPFQQKLLAPKSLSSPPHLLFIGHEWKRKGLDRLLEALSFLKNENFLLTVVGKEKHPEYFFDLAKKFHIQEKTRFYPTGQKSLPFYQTSQIAILPSRYDPFANVTLEAMAMGLYVITTTANGGSEAIINHLNGIIVDEYAPPSELAEAIRAAFFVATDSSRPETIRHSVRHYDFSLKLQQIISLLEEDEL
jgi:UDP-glucose:(heptosyl)LPS alpha-1,3-glucosyltransferase